MSIYTSGEYLRRNPSWHEEDAPWKATQILGMLRKHQIVPVSLCEVGCGTGTILDALYAELPTTELVGFEVSPQALDRCAQRARPRLQFFGTDFTKHGRKFDVAMAIDVFEHVEDYFTFLREIRDLGSYKLFHIPLEISVSAALRATPFLEARSSVGHIHHFNAETAIATLEDCGYGIVDSVYTAGALALPRSSWKSRAAKIPRALLYRVSPALAARLLGGFSLLVLAR